MGQIEVLNFLDGERVLSDKYFTVREIQKALQDKGLTNGVIKGVHKAVIKLVMCNFIEWHGQGYWNHHKEFRGKKNGN